METTYLFDDNTTQAPLVLKTDDVMDAREWAKTLCRTRQSKGAMLYEELSSFDIKTIETYGEWR
jgi:hypothetical protein